MPCALLAIPIRAVIGEKVRISPLHPEVKALLGDHSLLVGCAQKAGKGANGDQKVPVPAAPLCALSTPSHSSQTVIGEKVEKALLGDHSLLAGHEQKTEDPPGSQVQILKII